MVYCDKCGTENQDNVKFCRECGHKITVSNEMNTIVCIKCDHLNPMDTKFCEKCGKKIIFNKETKLKSNIISAVLEYEAWVSEVMPTLKEGSIMKSEARAIFKEAELRLNKLLKVLKGGKKKTKEKELIVLINEKIKEKESELIHAKELAEKS